MSQHIPYEHKPGAPHQSDENEGLARPGHDEHVSHGGNGKYVAVFVALLVLTTMSFLTQSRFWPLDHQGLSTKVFMMIVSCCKALLVILFFMHIKYEAGWKYVLTIPAGLMSVFLIVMLVPDIGNRGRMYSEERAKHAAVPGATAEDPFALEKPHAEHGRAGKHDAPTRNH